MPRPKLFDREKVIQNAIPLFRQRGYEATSMDDIVAHLGLSRSSLYDTFGDKHNLFLEALQMYRLAVVGRVKLVLEGDGTFYAAVKQMFDTLLDDQQNQTYGCFMVNSIAELLPQDTDVADIATRYAEEIQQLLIAGICRAQARGEVDALIEAKPLALFLFNNVQGLRILLKSGVDKSSLYAIRDYCLDAIR